MLTWHPAKVGYATCMLIDGQFSSQEVERGGWEGRGKGDQRTSGLWDCL